MHGSRGQEGGRRLGLWCFISERSRFCAGSGSWEGESPCILHLSHLLLVQPRQREGAWLGLPRVSLRTSGPWAMVGPWSAGSDQTVLGARGRCRKWVGWGGGSTCQVLRGQQSDSLWGRGIIPDVQVPALHIPLPRLSQWLLWAGGGGKGVCVWG